MVSLFGRGFDSLQLHILQEPVSKLLMGFFVGQRILLMKNKCLSPSFFQLFFANLTEKSYLCHRFTNSKLRVLTFIRGLRTNLLT